MQRIKLRPALAVAIAATFLLSGCGGAASSSQATGSATRTVESESGSVTIPSEPQAALGMYTTDLDMLITLGIPLAKSQPIRDNGYASYPAFFDQEALKGITPFNNFPEHNYEAILGAAPDLILNGLGYDEKIGPKLTAIAPTYTFNGFDGSDWRGKFKQVAQDLGKTAEYTAWMDKYQAKVDEVKAKLAAAKLHPVVAPVGYSEGKANVSCYGVPCLVFKDLGLEISPLSTPEGSYLSTEQLEQLNGIDAIFTATVPNPEGGKNTSEFAELDGNKLWAALPFVSNKEIHTFDLEMLYGSPSGQYAFLETVEKALVP